MEVVSPDKNSDLTVNSTHSQSSISFPSNKCIITPDALQNLKNSIDSDFNRIHSVTPIIRHVKTPSLQIKETSCTRPSVGANYLTGDTFWQERILFLRREHEKKQQSTSYLIFYITIIMKSQSNFFFAKTPQKKTLRKCYDQ